MRKTEPDQKVDWVKWCKAITLGGLMAGAVALLCLLTASLLIANGSIGGEVQERVLSVAVICGTVAGVLAAGRMAGGNSLLLGLLTAGMLILLRLCGALLTDGSVCGDGQELILDVLVLLCGGGIGTVLAGKRGRKKARHRIRIPSGK